ncbi:ubiquinone biosynthesis protein-like protein coq-8 [Clohesyomyces aquaticus]|uniref:Ubiquinone biosynthesis protein-like protein coq-8 n=1 Tax=Clohesyomyces aquaticus TaxID=1231657 RepID=A0A1Y2A0Q7_9PLEO|nr:ubiquinone biosynthesis protein-like protein coq-8 [Clohesyomyces aquaticus]
MAGRRLVDVVKLFNASKSVAKQHLNLRSQQLDVYNRTSSLAKAVKSQTERVTVTAQAAIALYQRSNDSRPPWAAPSPEPSSHDDADIPRRETVRAETPRADMNDGLEQDHHYDQSGKSTTAEPPPEEASEVEQEEAERRPLPDGTTPSAGIPKGWPQLPPDEARKLQRKSEGQIPAHANEPQPPTQPHLQRLNEGHDRDVFYARSVESKPQYSSLPRTKIPKHTEDAQESGGHVQDGNLNQDVYYSTPEPAQPGAPTERIPHEAAVPEQEQIPEGINTDVFRTARVAKMLGGNPYTQKPQLDLKGASKTPRDHTTLAAGHDQDTFNVRSSEQTEPSKPAQPVETAQTSHEPPEPAKTNRPSQATTENEMKEFASDLAKDAETAPLASEIPGEVKTEPDKAAYALRESRVPSSRFGRLWEYAGLGASMAFGAAGESLRRATGSAVSTGGSVMLSPGNMEILVAKLSRMRGAALKLGQLISFQDKMLPPAISEVLQRVQDSADYMPASQRNKVLASNLGSHWRDLFDSFEDVPIAAASIGQVHKAILRSTKEPVAVKVQYPGVANSIDSDLSNLSILLTASRLLPKGLYLDKTIANARTELGWECNYLREADCQTRFRDLLADDTEVFTVPKVIPEASSKTVLTMELMDGIGVTKLPALDQAQRDWIGTQILRLCLREIVEFKFMQTDPNWTNFLYNPELHKIELLDFGASRDYPDEFVDPYINILIAASKVDRPRIKDLSIELGYLTGNESQAMLEAHVNSVLTLAEPFLEDGPEVYDFRDQTITDRVRGFIPVMVRERLAPPPEETYSLHRKLSGAFLLCARLGSRVPCRKLFERAVETYRGMGEGRIGDVLR